MAERKDSSSHIENTQANQIDTAAADHATAGYVDTETQKETSWVLDGSDEARKVERQYKLRLNYLVLPTVSALYFFEYLDRGNIANAKLLGLADGHKTKYRGVGPGVEELTAGQWEVVIMMFYVGLILFQVPGCIGYRIFPPSKWIAFGVCFWCITSMLQCVATSYASLLVCRVFLGAFEGLFGTGILYYLSLWYHRTELGVRVFWFLGPTAIAGAFGGLIAFGVSHIEDDTPLWKYLFLIEALPGFCLGLFCLYWLPDRPLKNSRFKGEHQQVATARYHAEAMDRTGPIQRKHVMWAVTDWKLYMQAAIYIPTAALLSSISGFLPSVVQELGYESSTSANLMTVPPYACAFVLMFITSTSSDYFKERGIHISVLSAISAICYIVMATLPADALHAKYALVCITTACVYSTYPPSHAWTANNFGNETKRAIGVGVYTAIGNCGSIAGSFFYPSNEAPVYRQGHYRAFGMSLAALVFSLANSLMLRAVNRHRDKKYGRPEPGLAIDVTENADNMPMWRFIT